MNAKTNPTVGELLSMSPEQLTQHWYERTQYGVQKLVNPLVTQIDLSPLAILKRAGIDPTVESMNAHFTIDNGNVKLVELDTAETISWDTNRHGDDVIRVKGILSDGNAIEIAIGIEYISKFPEDESSRGHIVPDYIKSTELWGVKWKLFRSFNRDDFPEEDGEYIEWDWIFSINGKRFVPWYIEDPGNISVKFTEK